MPTTFINVRVGRLPGLIKEVTLNGDRTVATALCTAGLSVEGYDLRVQGLPATMNTLLNEGDIVLLVKKIKGNGFAVVKIGRVPGVPLVEVALDETTVYAALQAAGITLGMNEEVYINDRLGSVGEPVSDGDTVVVKRATVGSSVAPPLQPPPLAWKVALSGGKTPAGNDTDLEGRAATIVAKAKAVEEVAEALKAYREAMVDLEDAIASYEQL